MIETAIKANVPFVGTDTDDLINLERVLAHMAGRPAKRFATAGSAAAIPTLGPCIYWTDRPEHATTDIFHAFRKNELTLVFVNCPAHLSIVDCGALEAPKALVDAFLSDHFTEAAIPEARTTLQGLSLRVMELVVAMTSARCANVTMAELRATRTSLMGTTPGLEAVPTDMLLYTPQSDLKAWTELNRAPFMKPQIAALIPRGLLFTGPTGTGKTSAAKYIAAQWQVPLYRIDIGSMVDRYVGSGEKALKRALSLVDRAEPCVLLLDEIEKVLADQDDGGVTKRIMSMLLWWLAEHTSRVFTVMTSNNEKKLPPELYREERIDHVLPIVGLETKAAQDMALSYLTALLPNAPAHLRNEVFLCAAYIDPPGAAKTMTPARVRQYVIERLKKHLTSAK